MIRVVLVGCGYIAQAEHIPNWRQLPGAELIAVVDTRRELADQVAEAYGLKAFYTLDDALAEVDVDAVHLSTPPESHVALIEAAAAVGKHVIVEKPLAIAAEAGERAVSSAGRAGIVLMVGYPRAFDADLDYLAGLIRDQRYGRVLAVHSVYKLSHEAAYTRIGEFERTLPRMTPDGSDTELRWRLLDQSIHHLNLLATWFGGAPAVDLVQRQGHLWSIAASAPDGTPLNHINAGRSGHGEEFHAYFEGAEVHVRPWSPHLPSTYGNVAVAPSAGEHVFQPVLARRNPYMLMLRAFIRRLDGQEEWQDSAKQAVADLALIDEIVALRGSTPDTPLAHPASQVE